MSRDIQETLQPGVKKYRSIKKSTINYRQPEDDVRSNNHQTIYHQSIKTDAYYRTEVLEVSCNTRHQHFC